MTGQFNYPGEREKGTMNTTTNAVHARQLQLDGRRGRIYGPIDLDLPVGSLTLVTGRAGTGKTSLLLTLVGRLKPNRGAELEVLGQPLPARAARIQRRSAAIGIHGLDDLDEEVSVGATLRERQAWLAPWYRIVRTPGDAQVAEACAAAFGDRPVPPARHLVHALDETENLRLRIALALISRPDLIVVDDIDQLHDTQGREQVWQTLRSIAGQGVTVLASASSSAELDRLGDDQTPLHVPLPSLP